MRLSCRLAPLRLRPSGVPVRSTTPWRFVPGLPQSVGFGSVPAPPFSRNGQGVECSPAPVESLSVRQALEQGAMQARPHTGRLPVAQPAPARHARTADLKRQHLPRNAQAQDEDDTSQRCPIIEPGPATSGLRRLGRQEWLNRRPENIRHKNFGHGKPTHSRQFA
jgi:hypothetical protein